MENMGRDLLESIAVRVLGESSRALVRKLSKRQIHEAVLHKLAPTFELDGRSDDALAAAFEHVVGSLSSPTPSAPRRLTDEEQRQKLVAEFAVLETQRQEAWKGGKLDQDFARRTDAQQPVRRVDGVRDFDAELIELEEKRQNAARPKPPLAPQRAEKTSRRIDRGFDYDFVVEFSELEAKRQNAWKTA